MDKVEKLNSFVENYFLSYIVDDNAHRQYREKKHYYAKSGYTHFYNFYSYSTLVAQITDKGDKVYLNTVRYSPTTSRIQNTIRKMAKMHGVEIVECDGETAVIEARNFVRFIPHKSEIKQQA